MSNTKKRLSLYYGEKGDYLKDHESFLKSANINKDIKFLVKALNLKKTDNILDIACGQGRHTNTLAKKGYKVDGVDFSQHLLNIAKKNAKAQEIVIPNYYNANIEKLNLQDKYSKAFWFFSDLAGINIPKSILSISKNLKIGGSLLLDTDNFFRILFYLQNNPKSNYKFDVKKLELIDKKTGIRVQYPVLMMWEEWFKLASLSIKLIIGDYNFSDYSINSPRLIMIVKKTA
ncbi:hypothetical protein C0583_00190 [Candidatus Parcubacteria bacterium]|nr:MAG: hypothetical protein C0583_00190 [Candidatus Parcubacteria bacterium]